MAAPKARSGLGRGLGDLIRPTSEPERHASDPGGGSVTDTVPGPQGSYFADVPVHEVRPNPRQPRQAFDEDEMSELVASIVEVGLLQPVVVRPIDPPEDGVRFELVMGERRLRATKAAGLAVIPAIVRETAAHDLLRDALLENLHRAELNPLEEAAAYQQMLEDFGCTQEELAVRIKRSRPQISNTIRLLRLPAPVQRRVAAGVLTAGHARALLMLADPVAQERLAQRIAAENLSVRAVEEAVSMGQSAEGTQRVRTPPEPSPHAEALARRFSDVLETRVNVAIGRTKGRITIEFATQEDLDRILGLMRVGVDTTIDI